MSASSENTKTIIHNQNPGGPYNMFSLVSPSLKSKIRAKVEIDQSHSRSIK